MKTPSPPILALVILAVAAALFGGIAYFRSDRVENREPETARTGPVKKDSADPHDKGPAAKADPRAPAPDSESPNSKGPSSTLLSDLADALRNNDVERVRKLLDQLKTLAVPPRISDPENGAILFEEAFRRIRNNPMNPATRDAVSRLKSGAEISDEDKALLQAWLQTHKTYATLDLLKHGARHPEFRFNLDYDKGWDLTHGALTANWNNVMHSWDYLQVVQKVQPVEDASWILLQLSEATRRIPVANAQVVSAKMDGDALQALQNEGLIGKEALALYAEKLSTQKTQANLQKALYGEAYFVLDYYLKMKKGKTAGVIDMTYKEENRDLWPHIAATNLELIRDTIKALDQPYHQIRSDLETMQLTQGQADPTHPDVGGYASIIHNTVTMAMQGEVSRRIIRIAAKIEKHKSWYGAYPSSLELLGEVPRDPLTGESFIYNPQGGGFTLKTSSTEKQHEGLAWKSGP